MKKSALAAIESGAAQITPEQLEQIHRYTRRSFLPEELYVFPLILCDNDLDRDLERFDDAALQALAGLFLGKTGVFDHAPRATNQSARIFDTAVEAVPDRRNALGQPYRRLRAWAWMVRGEHNRDLILEIDGGIKREVSVGCAVGRVCCSICGADCRRQPCAHRKGEEIDGALCHHLLLDPTDAWEWSFVAVPAQREAGVTKVHRRPAPAEAREGAQPPEQWTGPLELHKVLGGEGALALDAAQRAGLARQLEALQAPAAGEARWSGPLELRKVLGGEGALALDAEQRAELAAQLETLWEMLPGQACWTGPLTLQKVLDGGGALFLDAAQRGALAAQLEAQQSRAAQPQAYWTGPLELHKVFAGEGALALDAEQRGALAGELAALREKAAAGDAWAGELRRQVVRLAALSGAGLDPAAVEEVAAGMAPHQLQSWCQSLQKTVGGRFPAPQLAGAQACGDAQTQQGAYRV